MINILVYSIAVIRGINKLDYVELQNFPLWYILCWSIFSVPYLRSQWKITTFCIFGCLAVQNHAEDKTRTRVVYVNKKEGQLFINGRTLASYKHFKKKVFAYHSYIHTLTINFRRRKTLCSALQHSDGRKEQYTSCETISQIKQRQRVSGKSLRF